MEYKIGQKYNSQVNDSTYEVMEVTDTEIKVKVLNKFGTKMHTMWVKRKEIALRIPKLELFTRKLKLV